MTTNDLRYFRSLASAMNLDGNYQVFINRPDGTREIKAFNLPKERAENWSKFWKGSKIEEVKK